MYRNLNFKIKSRGILLLLFFLVCSPVPDLRAQQNYPGRTIRSDEKVTLDSSLPLKTAIDILSQYSMKHEGKIIINSQTANPAISVVVNNMFWKRALEYILRSNLLKYEEKDRHYEIIPLIKKAKGPKDDLITTSSREIEINAVFFEANYQTLRQAGVNWSAINGGRVEIFGNFAPQQASNDITAQVRRSFRSVDLFAFLRAVESFQEGEVIANPQIKVLEGEEGKIKVGQNFFLTTTDFAGNTIFQEYESGIILTVTPIIVGGPDSMFVHLDIRAERSTVVPAAQAVTKTITESKTQVLLMSGEETVVAGLFSNTENEVRRGLPLLKDLPPWFFGLRYLFGFNSTSVTKRELVIVLQANILPSISDRIAARSANRRIYIDKKRQEFLRKMRQLKTSAPPSKSRINNRRRR